MAVTANLSISLDGYYTGPSPSALHPLGHGGDQPPFEVPVVPMLLRSGRSLFESLGFGTIQFTQNRAVAGNQVTHVRYGHFSVAPDVFVTEAKAHA